MMKQFSVTWTYPLYQQLILPLIQPNLMLRIGGTGDTIGLVLNKAVEPPHQFHPCQEVAIR